MNVRTKQKFKMTLILLTILVPTTMFSMILLNQGNIVDYGNTTMDGDIDNFEIDKEDDYYPNLADITHFGGKYDLSLWWNKTYRFRIGFVLEETEGIDRYQPVEVYFTFRENEHYENTERLVSFNATGNDEWSNTIPIQIWNVTKYTATNFIESCTITFIVDISANSNNTYFLYYNDNENGIEQIDYGTNFSSDLIGGVLTVNVGTEYQVVLEQGLASTQLKRQGLDFHSDDSLAPEKQLSDPSLKFLAHFENTVADSTGNTPGGTANGDPQYVNGLVQYGMDFDGDDFVSYPNGLEALGDPFHDASTEFTVCAWINPTTLSTGATNHQTQNVIMAKASDPYNDNFEIGVNYEGDIHVYLDTETDDRYDDFGVPGTIETDGGWYFIVFRYKEGVAEVRIQDTWYPPSSTWAGATDIDGANNSPFTIGASEHINQYFDGMIDEVAVYNKSLTDQEVEDFKYGSMPSTIQSITELENGDVFSSYEIEWTTAFDMHVQDTCTFYYDYDLWNFERNIYFENEFNSTIDRMFALNTNYNFTSFNDHNELLYIYDGVIKKDITTAGFVAENYTVIHNAPDGSKDAIGIFIEEYELSDPAHTSISYFKGDVIYDNGYVEFLPGSLNDFDNSVGNESYKLKINFWELTGSANTTGNLDNTGLINYFDEVLVSLREEVDVYMYTEESLFYSIDVSVTDSDGNFVPDATVTVWNSSNYAINWEQTTNENGRTLFNRFEGGIYVVNVSYVRYGQTLTVTTPQIIELNDTNVDTNGIYHLEFNNVKLTSLLLKFQREDAGIIQEDVVGANVTFTFDDGSGPVVLGYELTNSTGFTTFRWTNLTDQNSGNVSLTVTWHGDLQTDISCFDDLEPPIDPTRIVLPIYQYLNTIVNVTTGSTYKSFLYVNSSGTDSVILGNPLNIWVNYTQQKDSEPIAPIEVGTVSYDIKIGSIQLNTIALTFSETGNGVYSLLIDTSTPIQPGGIYWKSSVTYTMEITASKPGYITNQTSITFTLLDKTSELTTNDATPQAFYHDMISLDVHYTDIFAEPDEDIDGATVQYFAIGIAGINGYLTPYGSGGLYRLDLDSSEFPIYGDYILQISAFKENYETKSIYLPLTIDEINTRLNNSAAIYETFDVFIGTSKTFSFDYSVELSGAGLTDVDLSECEWEKEVGGVVVDSGVVSLNSLGNGLYELDMDTETLEIASYTLVVRFAETNYVERDAIIFLNIVPRVIGLEVNDIIPIVSGNDLSFDIALTDTFDASDLINAEVYLILDSIRYDFADNGDGTYSVTIPDSSIVDAFFFADALPIDITINKANYSSKTERITIQVNITEIFPGFPMFYFLMIVGAIVAVVGSLVAYRQIQRARIPTFVKKSREMSKNIKGRKSISDSLLYPSKEEYIIKKLGDKWETLGLSLEEILGHSSKKTKNLPKKTELEGGGL
ncbi:MAG: hypothetical protein HWN80_14365 [Candidatus Lokiarchaeota archaeon]|nr:hypothetical protein [Candidatus Lokiarchaeota archaeon]